MQAHLPIFSRLGLNSHLYLGDLIFMVALNRPFSSSLVPLFQSESKCKTILMKTTLICMKMKLHAELGNGLFFLRSSKNAFIMQSKSTFLEFLRGIHRYKFGPPKKFFRGKIIQGE